MKLFNTHLAPFQFEQKSAQIDNTSSKNITKDWSQRIVSIFSSVLGKLVL